MGERFIYQGEWKDLSGNVVSDGRVRVMLANGLTDAKFYETETGSTSANNYVTSGSDGHFLFWVDSDDYSELQKFKIILQKTDFTQKEYDDIQIFPIGTIGRTDVSSSYNVVNADEVLICNGTFTVEMMALADADDKIFYIKNIGTGAVTIEGDSAEPVDGSTSTTIYQYEDVPLVPDTTNTEWRVL